MEAEGIPPEALTTNIELNKKIDDFKSKLDLADKESPLVSKLMAVVAQDAAFTYPIYKKLDKAGVPKAWSLPIAFGLGGTLAFDKAQTFFVDSAAMRGLKDLIGVEPNTPIEEMYDKTIQALEYSAFGKFADTIFNGAKAVKKMNLQQPAIATGGAGIAGEGAIRVQENAEENLNVENQNLSEEKKTLNFDDQSKISSPMPNDNLMASAGLGPIFKSIVRETAKKLPNKGTGEQIFNTLKNSPGVKSSELKWTGLDDFLKGKKSVTKEEIQDYLKNNTLDVAEIQLPRQVKTDPKADELYKNLNEDYGKLFDELGTLPQNQGRMVNPFNYTLTNVLEDGRRINEAVSMDTLDNIFIGQRLSTYIPPTKMMSKGKYYDKSKLIDDFGKKGEPDTLEFYMFEDNVSGKMTAVRKQDLDNYINKENPFSGGTFEYSYKTEMNIKEAEMYMTMRIRDKLERVVARNKDLGKTKFSGMGYVEPGGEDYKEIVFKLKGDKDYPVEIPDLLKAEPGKATPRTKKTINYTSPNVHFGTKNEFAHVRFKTRDLNGQKVLSVEEMQSDIVQDMKQYGTVDFPFKNNWYELVTKRLIRYAADNGFDAVAIPKGSTIASRYKQKIVKKDGKISGSGKGKAELYDLAIPSYLKKYAKKWNAKVYNDNIKVDPTVPMDSIGYAKDKFGTNIPVTIIKLTPEMKKAVQQDSQALFNIFGIGSSAAVGAKALSDSKGNNTISNQTVY
jgi:hypothetical protein